MIKNFFLWLCLCIGFMISSNICYVNNKSDETYNKGNSFNEIYNKSNSSNETYGESNSALICLANKDFSNCLIKMKSLERVEKVIKYDEKERKADEEKERKAQVCFNSYDIGIPSGITHEEMANVLNHSHYANFLEFSNAFVDAEKEYKVNAFALVAISGAESRWNKTERANDGSNNITGMDVQSDFSRGTIYNSKYDCIMDLARQLRLYYLTPGSCYYKGVSTSKVNIYYSADSKWYKNIDQIGDELIFEYDRLYR